MKTCFKCQRELPLSDFYKHKQMADGHLNKCRECTKADSTANRWKNIDRIRKYDRDRGARQPPEYQKEYRAKFPVKHKARTMVGNAIRDKKLFTEPCAKCGSTKNIHAHHDDYAKPLNVRWLCSACHSQWHRDNGPGLNG
jgi:ribosomal protein S27AE